MKRPEARQDVTIHLWERLAFELVAIIGEGGFQSLYARSVHLSRVDYPWMELNHPSQQSASRFAGLQVSLEGRDITEASEAGTALLSTFIDILASLIGETLTNSILCSAWGDGASDLAAKELQQ
jgi:hypothetical protein